MHNKLTAVKTNWIPFDKLETETKCFAKIRSTQIPTEATIYPNNDGSVSVVFEDMQKSIATGQSVVFYNDDLVLGGGIIDSVE